jgi:exopolysaccharide biosynthesis polyprenyl glycosylphosphotransferase
VRRALLAADITGLVVAFIVAESLFGPGSGPGNTFAGAAEYLVFAFTLPIWVVVAKLYGLYAHDEERTDHTTVDDIVGVFHMVTVGAWILVSLQWVTSFTSPDFRKLFVFWAVAIAVVTGGRGIARGLCRRHPAYLQNTVIVGVGDVAQLIARKVNQHPEYRINLLGFIEGDSNELSEPSLPVLGPPDQLSALVTELGIERAIIAFPEGTHREALELIRSLKTFDVQIDVVPSLFEIVGPSANLHSLEGLPLVGLPPVRISRSSRAIKRMIDVTVAIISLVVAAPLFAYAAWRIKRESPGPVFFRQTRLGMNGREFTPLKFRTMKVDTDESVHRDFIRRVMDLKAVPEASGIYKLDRADAVTPFGCWLRKTSLDELPQLINVLRGEMSLVGPRPCIPYETEGFEPHHFERFLVPQGMTGLWQVTARAHSTFREALEMDVTYVRSWSLRLDIWLLMRTPFRLLATKGTA